jgi:hypothetical protein
MARLADTIQRDIYTETVGGVIEGDDYLLLLHNETSRPIWKGIYRLC